MRPLCDLQGGEEHGQGSEEAHNRHDEVHCTTAEEALEDHTEEQPDELDVHEDHDDDNDCQACQAIRANSSPLEVLPSAAGP